ncbi:hypothetical protein [Stutzerimonas nitrititolerans]|uniref:hypothetical protein n=1 Tax=Stutzerimonas nitrititolerans TaxID=2482751 RepID=UPI002649FCEE|nr:hypothetical protein [Stutzerimonas nitrititolerans]
MAIYTVQNGQLIKVAATLEEFVGQELIEDYDKFLAGQGFYVLEKEVNAYTMLSRREEGGAPGELAKVRYIFDVEVSDDSVEYIFVEDELGDLLAVIGKLEPLVAKGLRLESEFEQSQGRFTR